MARPKITVNITDAAVRKMVNDLSQWALARRAQIKDATSLSLINIQRKAKRAAPVNKQVGYGGRLRAAINIDRNPDGMGGSVIAATEYAVYQEFGTGEAVKIPLGLEDYARQFKGKGVRKINIKPQPFLFPAAEAERPQYIDKITEALNNE
jgi:HK97 gp10 family phage protein